MSDDTPSIFDGLEGQRRTIDDYADAPAVAWGACPACLNDKVGLTRSGQHLVWKAHWVTLWGGAVRQCLNGSKLLCEAPARESSMIATPICPHNN